MTEKEIIEKAYDAGVDEEFERLISTLFGEVEFDLITELMEQYIQDGATVLDIGSGPGRYSEYLLQLNCKVGLIDLSEKSLKAFNDRVRQDLKKNVLFIKPSCATDLSFINDRSADAVLLMGPMYHLTSSEDRERALSECYRKLKPGGILFVTFMSLFPKLYAQQEINTDEIVNEKYIMQLLKDGISTVNFHGYTVPQYRCFPSQAKKMIEDAGFKTIRVRNIEGIGSSLNLTDFHSLKDYQSHSNLLNLLRQTCENEDLLGFTQQFLYVGKKLR